VPQLEWYVDLRVFVERRGEGASIMESLYKSVLLDPPVTQPDIKRLPLILWQVNARNVPTWLGFGHTTRDVADGHIPSYIKSANVHVNGWRGYPIEED